MSDDEINENIDEFEKYRKTKILNISKQKVRTINLQKYKLKPKRAPKTMWLCSSNDNPVSKEDDKEVYEDKFSFEQLFEQLSKKDKEIILKAWNENFNGRKKVLLNPHKDDVKNIKILIAYKRKFLHKLNNLLNKNKKKNLMLISQFEDSIKFLNRQLKETEKQSTQKTGTAIPKKYKLKPKRAPQRFWLV